MLSRTAEDLFWIARNVERAENMARLMEMGYRMALMPASDEGHRSEWGSVIEAAGVGEGFRKEHGDDVRQQTVANYLLFDRANASSVTNCLERARSNARAMRTALTIEMWSALNEAWLEWQQILPSTAGGGGLPDLLDWIKKQGAYFRGATDGSLLRGDGFEFIGIGRSLERADNMARLLDVKYYVLLPETNSIGGGLDQYQWTTVLRAASSLRAYHWAYRSDYSPRNIVDFLILNPFSPRSLFHCYRMLGEHLNGLGRLYGRRHPCHMQTNDMIAKLSDDSVDEIFGIGLHEFLTDFIGQNARVASQIALAYHFSG